VKERVEDMMSESDIMEECEIGRVREWLVEEQKWWILGTLISRKIYIDRYKINTDLEQFFHWSEKKEYRSEANLLQKVPISQKTTDLQIRKKVKGWMTSYNPGFYLFAYYEDTWPAFEEMQFVWIPGVFVRNEMLIMLIFAAV